MNVVCCSRDWRFKGYWSVSDRLGVNGRKHSRLSAFKNNNNQHRQPNQSEGTEFSDVRFPVYRKGFHTLLEKHIVLENDSYTLI